MKRFIAAFALFLATTFHAHAGTYSGIWWNQNESGWGITLTQQFDTLFAAMYVYNVSGQPTWYSATLKPTSGAAPNNYTGELFAATGPFYGGSFTPLQVQLRRVGTMTFNAPSFAGGTLSYNVDGLAVSKSITPLSFTTVPGTGTYATTVLRDVTNNCNIPALNVVPTQLVIGATSLEFVSATGAPICSASGGFSQRGTMYGFISTSQSCLPGGSLVVLDLRIEGVAGITNNNLFMTGAFIFENAARSCLSAYYAAGVRSR